MKTALAEALSVMARRDPSIVLLTGDLGYGAFEDFATEFGARFINCGVAEQNMLGVAGGLSAEGLHPAVYSIGNFLVLRAAEQIRNDIVAQRRPVLLIAAGGGFTYGAAGNSHHLTEDLAFARSLAGLTIFTPAFADDVPAMVEDWIRSPRPVYIRLDRPVTGCPSEFELGKWRLVSPGSDVTIFAIGQTVDVATAASLLLRKAGVDTAVVDCNQLTNLDSDQLEGLLSNSSTLVTVEEHSTIGGLGSLICEEVASRGLATRVNRFGASGGNSPLAGSPAFYQAYHGIAPEMIADQTMRSLGTTGP